MGPRNSIDTTMYSMCGGSFGSGDSDDIMLWALICVIVLKCLTGSLLVMIGSSGCEGLSVVIMEVKCQGTVWFMKVCVEEFICGVLKKKLWGSSCNQGEPDAWNGISFIWSRLFPSLSLTKLFTWDLHFSLDSLQLLVRDSLTLSRGWEPLLMIVMIQKRRTPLTLHCQICKLNCFILVTHTCFQIILLTSRVSAR